MLLNGGYNKNEIIVSISKDLTYPKANNLVKLVEHYLDLIDFNVTNASVRKINKK